MDFVENARHPLVRPGALAGWAAGVVTVLLVAGTIRLDWPTGSTSGTVGHYAYLLLAPPFTLAGILVTSLRRTNVIGALMLVVGVGIAADEYTNVWSLEHPASEGLLWWLSSWLWTVPIVVMVLGVLVFPSGALPGPRWRPVAWVVGGWGAGLVLIAAASAGRFAGRTRFPEPPATGTPGWRLHLFLYAWYAAFPLLLAVGAAAVVVRYRRARGAERAQLRWLCAAAVLNAGIWLFPQVHVLGSWARAGADLALWLLPGAVTVAVLRYRLYDIDRIINRALVYGALTVAVGTAYALVVAASAIVVEPGSSLVAASMAAVVAATLFAPLRSRLQNAVDRLLYGARREPREVVSRLGRRLESALPQEQLLDAIVDTVGQNLRLPYVALELRRDDGWERACVRGTPAGEPAEFGLAYRGDVLGRLLVGPRAPGEPFTAAERDLLADLARHAGMAVHAVRLTADLQRSRERLVTAREEERRRLRRDLHDGLGPTLAGIAFRLDATAGVLATRPEHAAGLLRQVRAELTGAVGEVRRLVEGLRPPELDVLGLAGAVRHHARRLENIDSLTFEVRVDEPIPPLPAAVEVAAYRIAAEAVTNVLRHAGARRCVVSLAVTDALELRVEDDGRGLGSPQPGFGLRSMHERADELGGSCRVEGLPGRGTTVRVSLPMPAGSVPG